MTENRPQILLTVLCSERVLNFTERYFRQGMRVSVSGRIQTGSYTNRDGLKVYTTEVVVEEQEFAESKNASSANTVLSGSPGTGAKR